mgnify:CR=1 FL=1
MQIVEIDIKAPQKKKKNLTQNTYTKTHTVKTFITVSSCLNYTTTMMSLLIKNNENWLLYGILVKRNPINWIIQVNISKKQEKRGKKKI